ncbi:Vesicle-fusing ATPase 2 like protein [Argiope bruennichi]|uniref:Vesicle-fusing ATPase n=1 Tax=Argiope bruennichi TaxID=94029 RepID=A0A8T0EJF8_ARGBR|nr:Vesicle-fusing ATPase 2 like protein [Argiope bruennichi]
MAFQKIGIGALDKELNTLFRRVFASRVLPTEFVQKLGLKHVKGILLYGPPGTGKTLMARKIGEMLNAKKPKMINGPQILDKHAGESEANVRRLFAEAEEDDRMFGLNSGLHVIIIDEIDAICKTRGSVAGDSGIHDAVTSQLLAKIDGFESVSNILVIGMTCRKEVIDEALLRPGRLEVQIEIGLPDEKGLLHILNIHTSLMKKHNRMAEDVNLEELAAITKNFTGAEIEGLVRAAQSVAINRLLKESMRMKIGPEATGRISITRADFLHALKYDIKPAFGISSEPIERLISQGIINWGQPVADILEDGRLFIQQARGGVSRGLVSVLLEGAPNSGKTALAAKLALNSDFPFVKLCTPEDMVGYSETAKCQLIKNMFDDAYKSQLSCIIVDSIERLIDYSAIGPRYSNLVLQALLVLLKKEPPPGRKLLILCTSSRKQVLEEMDMLSIFTAILRVPYLSSPEDLVSVLLETNTFNMKEIAEIQKKTKNCRFRFQASGGIGVYKFLNKLREENCLQEI